VVEKAPLVIPLIQHNRWLSARKPEDLEVDDNSEREKKAVKVADVQQTGDKDTDAAVREILSGKSTRFPFLLNILKFYFGSEFFCCESFVSFLLDKVCFAFWGFLCIEMLDYAAAADSNDDDVDGNLILCFCFN